MTSLPSAKRLTALCGPAARDIALEIVAETGSTNADLLARVSRSHAATDSAASKTLEIPTLLWAQSQTAGKGRAGRNWHSSPEATLTFSLAWKFLLPPQALTGLPLAVGVAVAQTLTSLGVPVQLKWPNDILKNGEKLAGILIETASDKREPGAIWAIIGIGINLTQSDTLRAQIGRTVADVAELDPDRERLMADLLTDLAEALSRFGQKGFSAFADAWNRCDAFAGEAVNIVDRGNIVQHGIAHGVDDRGYLQLDTAQGRVAIAAGDVSLRIREG
jgi:BirA family transcriptional regulator, biotin operon repressor / biotin---[acetyl-CoA-carboxylase] ligase